MPEEISAENLIHNIMETIADNVTEKRNTPIFEEDKSKSATNQFDRLFGREKPVHHLLGGGKSADVLLWRNKKISASVLMGATVVWVLFEWLNYNFLTLLFLVIVVGMLAQFLWKNARGILSGSSDVPRLVLPEKYFISAGKWVGAKVNLGLNYLQDVSCGGNAKEFLMVIAILWVSSIIGSWCNFLTLFYIGFISAHILPVLYEKYEDEVDSFVYNVTQQLQHNYRKLDSRVLSRIPRNKFMGNKSD